MHGCSVAGAAPVAVSRDDGIAGELLPGSEQAVGAGDAFGVGTGRPEVRAYGSSPGLFYPLFPAIPFFCSGRCKEKVVTVTKLPGVVSDSHL